MKNWKIKSRSCGTVFDLAKKKNRIKELEFEVQEPDFWKNPEEAAKVQKEMSDLTDEIGFWGKISKELEELKELNKLSSQDDDLEKEIKEKLEDLGKRIKKKETEIFLSGKYDRGDATMTIYSGAGGQDAGDWAAMLLRMYQRYCEGRGWKTKILHEHFGEPGGPEGRIGIKNVTIEIKGKYTYGYLRNETGVHRLVRISPFSAQKLRHTSFALVEVLPIIDEPKEIEINPKDLQFDTFRASGPGGQYVNRRETAVRVTHLQTKISVACQSERLQGQNKELALKLLYSRLLALKIKEKKEELSEVRGEIVSAEWGNQIRSYVLHPYQMVKDHRTEEETSNIESVLDGDLDKFIEAGLRIR